MIKTYLPQNESAVLTLAYKYKMKIAKNSKMFSQNPDRL